jgi:hypothetical protein
MVPQALGKVPRGLSLGEGEWGPKWGWAVGVQIKMAPHHPLCLKHYRSNSFICCAYWYWVKFYLMKCFYSWNLKSWNHSHYDQHLDHCVHSTVLFHRLIWLKLSPGVISWKYKLFISRFTFKNNSSKYCFYVIIIDDVVTHHRESSRCHSQHHSLTDN